MAMQNWIAMRTDLRHDPSVGKIAVKMKVRVEVVIGYLHAVWSWADAATDDGVISGLTLDKAEELLSAPNFLHYMVDVGWLDYIESVNGCQIVFPNWETWMCNSTKKRLKQAKQKQLQRADKKRTNVRKKSAEKRTPCSSSSSSSSSSSKKKKRCGFDVFWNSVPNKIGKIAAEKSYDKAVTSLVGEGQHTVSEAEAFLLDRMQAYAKSDVGQSDYAKHPATWLNQGCWDDDPAAWNRRGEQQELRI